MAIYHHTTRMIGRSNGGSPVKALAYVSGISLTDQRTGEVFDFKDKSVQDVQIILPGNAPLWAKNIQMLVATDREKGIQLLSNIANAAEKRGDAQVYREIEFSLPRELSYEQNKKLAEEYVQDQFCSLGMLAIQNFHTETCEKTGEPNPHCHTFFLTRDLTDDGLSEIKNRDWNKRELHAGWREQWAQYATFHLKMHGHDITLDHRSYHDQGLDIEPQVKLGKGVKEQEKRAQSRQGVERAEVGDALERGRDGEGGETEIRINQEKSLSLEGSGPSNFTLQDKFIDAKPVTDRVGAFREVQLRNLYRILRRPETVFDIVTRHHATFMWGDVQKVLCRYVDEAELFQRLDARLKSSKELLLLRTEGMRDQMGHIEEHAIYTTRSMLKAERALVETAESLTDHKTHAVSSSSLEQGLGRMQAKLQKEGVSLSEGQMSAIRHLVDGGQLKCIVGYAGAGKTTALDACREIWEVEGYSVYGLAPTGRAAQNLEGSGISSQTLHKFLKSFEEGRAQYSDKSILILDEAGMVDVERFEAFLGAVKTLGVKAVVVGDAAQLQPVEAGPAFRLVTTRVGTSRLEEVVRQKEEWQKEATVLFGKQESQRAIQAYQIRGHIHLVKEKLPGPRLRGDGEWENKAEDVVMRYEMAARTSGLIFREIVKDIQGSDQSGPDKFGPDQIGQGQALKGENIYGRAKGHEDYPLFLKWRNVQKEAGKEILGKADVYRPFLEERRLDPTEMARLFVGKGQSKAAQYSEVRNLLKAKKLDHLIGVERAPGQTVEVRSGAKSALIEDWQMAYKEDPQTHLLMMAYSNRDVRDLNTQARTYLKDTGAIEKKEVTYTITREVEDDFGRKTKLKEERSFSKGDRIVFTRNNHGLGVKNGSIGQILALDKNSIEVKLDKGNTFSFSPNLNSFFDQGWAVTIHKSQGTTIDKGFLLASHEMNQNLTYVAMTRHRDDVQVYGSSCDFWREEKVADVLSKSGEKLGAADYLDAHSLAALMRDEDRFIDRIFTRLSDELHAMGAVSKRAFNAVADHFLGREHSHERDILIKPETIREEDRAHDLLQKSSTQIEMQPEYKEDRRAAEAHPGLLTSLEQKKENVTLQDVYEDMKHPAFNAAAHYKKVFEEGLKIYGEEGALQYWQSKREPFLKIYEQKLEAVEHELKSPLLGYLSDEARDLARKSAFEDPDKTLKFLSQIHASKQAEQDEKTRLTQESQRSLKEREYSLHSSYKESSSIEDEVRTKTFHEAFAAYHKFKDIKRELEDSPYDRDLKKEMWEMGKIAFKNKVAFAHIEKIDPDIGKEIQKMAQMKEKQLSLGRGGLSL